MVQIEINILAVVVGAIINMVIGMLWYGPLFGKQWMALMGFRKEDMGKMKASAMKAYVGAFVGALIMAYVLAHFVKVGQAGTTMDGAQIAFWAWLGFVATVGLGGVLWEKRSWSLYCFNMAYQLVSLLVMGAILAAWS